MGYGTDVRMTLESTRSKLARPPIWPSTATYWVPNRFENPVADCVDRNGCARAKTVIMNGAVLFDNGLFTSKIDLVRLTAPSARGDA